jgi:hypothetical protein
VLREQLPNVLRFSVKGIALRRVQVKRAPVCRPR